MTTTMKSMLGSGIYTVREAALYARVQPQLISRWLFGNQKGQAIIDAQYKSDERLVSFLDLVQTLAIREIRLQKRVPLTKIKQAIKTAKQFGVVYPFARHHTTFLWAGDTVVLKVEEKLIEASGKHKGQPLFTFVESYLEQLGFDADGLANAYKIFQSDGIEITMKPKIRFGEPLLPSGYSAKAIWDAIKAEGGIAEAADAYRIPQNEVMAAYKFFVDHIGKKAA